VKYCPENKFKTAVAAFEEDKNAGIEAITALVQQYPKDANLRHNYGAMLMQLENWPRAKAQLELAANLGRNPLTAEALCLVYANLGMNAHLLVAARRCRDWGGPDHVDDVKVALRDGLGEKDVLALEKARFAMIYENSSSAVRDLEHLARRFPDNLPILNLISSGHLTHGHLLDAKTSVEKALAVAPDNIHALLNLVRLTVLTEGRAAASALAPRLHQADVFEISSGEIARAQAFAYFGDDNAIADILMQQKRAVSADEVMPLQHLKQVLAQRQAQPNDQPPYMALEILLPSGMVERWRKAKKPAELAQRDLQLMPGLLAELPVLLGFDDGILSKLLTALLMKNPFPGPDGKNWSDILVQIAQHGPGLTQTRLDMASILTAEGLLPNTMQA
jgi:tetratricopeptide (TPR) repeat protein